MTASTAPAVITAVRVLDALTAFQGAATLDELTKLLDEPRSSVHRILNTLVESEILQRAGPRGGYRIGPKVMTWGSAFLQGGQHRRRVLEVATPIAARINETVQLAVLDSPDVVFVAYVDSERPVRLVSEVGRRLPAHATAVGKALLAFSNLSISEALPQPRHGTAHAADGELGRGTGASAREGPPPGLGGSQPGSIGEPHLPCCAGAGS